MPSQLDTLLHESYVLYTLYGKNPRNGKSRYCNTFPYHFTWMWEGSEEECPYEAHVSIVVQKHFTFETCHSRLSITY